MKISADYRLGFLGAGQLARMSAMEAFKLGVQVVSYSGSDELQPLDLLTPHHYPGSFDDEEKLVEFAKNCDVVTLENEFLDSGLLSAVQEKSGTPIYPTPESFRLIESKFIEKETFSNAGIPVAAYRLVKNPEEMESFGNQHGWPFLLKSSKGGYDGYGNVFVKTSEEANAGFTKLGGNAGHDILAEALVPFKWELAVSVARNKTGTVVFPCVETIQENHICRKVIAPARVSPQIQYQAKKMAIAAVEAINGIGIFAFEFFLTENGDLLLNESAPRPHNSGHYSMEACTHSQFALHVRSVMGLPLPNPEMHTPAAVMINILGTQNRISVAENLQDALEAPMGYFHLYGKSQSKIGRKMGHFTLLGNNSEQLLEKAEHIVNKMEV